MNFIEALAQKKPFYLGKNKKTIYKQVSKSGYKKNDRILYHRNRDIDGYERFKFPVDFIIRNRNKEATILSQKEFYSIVFKDISYNKRKEEKKNDI